MAGIPPDGPYSDFAEEHHHTWGVSGMDAYQARREEDINACEVLGAEARYFNWLDAIYRVDMTTGEPLIQNDLDLFGKAPDETLLDEIKMMIGERIPKKTYLVLPMGLGEHIDHKTVVQAARQLKSRPYYYADYPYILSNYDSPVIQSNTLETPQFKLKEKDLVCWQDAVMCYSSQLSYFWRDEEEARLALRNYFVGGGGRLWRKIK